MEPTASFQTVDYVMLGILLAVSMGIGVFFAVSGNRQSTKLEYLLGGRNMSFLPVCLSLFATFQSAISLLGVPAEVYTYGTMIIYMALGSSLASVFALYSILPLVYPLKLTSVYEYLEIRYGSKIIRLIGAFIGMLYGFSYMTMALLSPAIALQTVVKIPLWMSVVVVGGIGTIYTTIGGIRSVIWTDVFQSIIIFGGLIFVLIKGVIDAGGFGQMWQINEDYGRIKFNEWNPDPRQRHTIWGLIFGGAAYWASANFSQSGVQRLCSTKSRKHARLVLGLSIPLVIVFGVILGLTGLCVVAYFFSQRCDPLAAGNISNPNQLMPQFIVLTLAFLPGMAGIYMSSLFSGALSTLSSGINSLAANTIEDILMPFLKGQSESAVTVITKILVCLYGAAIIGTAYLMRTVSGPITMVTYAIISASGGPVLGLFILSATFPQANAVGAGCGTLLSLAACVWISVGRLLYAKAAPRLPSLPTDGCQSAANSTAWHLLYNVTTAGPGYDVPSQSFTDHTSSDWLGERSTILFSTEMTMRSPKSDSFSMYDVSYVWISLIGSLLTITIGLIVSLLYNAVKKSKSNRSTRPEVLFPFARRIWRMQTISIRDENGYDSDMEVDLSL